MLPLSSNHSASLNAIFLINIIHSPSRRDRMYFKVTFILQFINNRFDAEGAVGIFGFRQPFYNMHSRSVLIGFYNR